MKKTYDKPLVVTEPAFATLSGCSMVSDDFSCLAEGLSNINAA
jgi:hypothetical protein